MQYFYVLPSFMLKCFLGGFAIDQLKHPILLGLMGPGGLICYCDYIIRFLYSQRNCQDYPGLSPRLALKNPG